MPVLKHETSVQTSLKSYIAAPSNEQRFTMPGILASYGHNENQSQSVVHESKRAIEYKPNVPSTSNAIVTFPDEEIENLPQGNINTNTTVQTITPKKTHMNIMDGNLGSLFSGAVFGPNASVNINVYTNTSNHN